MIWGHLKILSVTRLAGSVVNSWSLTQEVVGSNNPFNYHYFLSLNEFSGFSENNEGKLCFPVCIIATVREIYAKRY